MIDDLEQLVGSAVTEVYGTMLNFRVQAEPKGSPVTNGEPHVAGAVGFIGRLTGVVYIYSSASFARKVTSGLLGIEDKDIEGDEMVNDAVGEITNMVVGYMKSRLSDRGMPCVLTIPSIVRGSHFTIQPTSSATRQVKSFDCNGSQVVVEVLIKPIAE